MFRNILIVITVFFSIILMACQASKKTVQANNNSPASAMTEAKLSPATKIFIQELKKEKETNQSSTFTPSENLIKKYKLRKLDNAYFIGGLITTTESINESVITNLGVKIGTKAGNIWTTQIPVGQLESFIKTQGISYIQIDEPPTHDSARFWARDFYKLGQKQEGHALDKEFLRQYLLDTGYDGNGPAPQLPQLVIDQVSRRCTGATEAITGEHSNLTNGLMTVEQVLEELRKL